MERMGYIIRSQATIILQTLQRHKGILLLGPRQTGKTTLIKHIQTDLTISLVQPEIRQRYEKDPGLLVKEIRYLKSQTSKIPIIVLDVYEHAYFIDYGVNRGSYIDSFFENLDWPSIEKRFEKVISCCQGQ